VEDKCRALSAATAIAHRPAGLLYPINGFSDVIGHVARGRVTSFTSRRASSLTHDRTQPTPPPRGGHRSLCNLAPEFDRVSSHDCRTR